MAPSKQATSSNPARQQPTNESDERSALLQNGSSASGYNSAEDGLSLPIEQKHFNLVGLSPMKFWLVCMCNWLSTVLVAFDGTVVATLLGPISSSFNATNLASWLGTSYMLSVCCFTPIYGRLANIIGRRASFMIALSIFGVGNLLCAVAPSMESLIAARALAGIGGGGMSTIGSTIASDIVPIHLRGLFQGFGNIWFGTGTALGGPLGGMLHDRFGWRTAFGAQIPLINLAIVAVFNNTRYTLPTSVPSGISTPVKPQTTYEKFRRVDFLGCFLLAGWLGSALIAVSLKTNSTDVNAYSWNSPTLLVLFGVAIILFVAFLFVELKWAAEPVIAFELLHKRTPIAVAINHFVLSIVQFAALYSVPLFFTAVRQMSASQAGQRLISNSILLIIGSLGCGHIVRSTGKYYTLTFIMGLIGISSCIWIATWSISTPDWQLWVGFGPQSLCFGAVTTTTIVGLMGDVGREHVAVATSLSYLFRTLGQVLGVALSGALLQTVLQKELSTRITGKGSQELIASIRQSSASIHTLPPILKAAATISYEKAIRAVFIAIIGLGLVATIAGLGMCEVDLQSVGTGRKKVRDEEDTEETEE